MPLGNSKNNPKKTHVLNVLLNQKSPQTRYNSQWESTRWQMPDLLLLARPLCAHGHIQGFNDRGVDA